MIFFSYLTQHGTAVSSGQRVLKPYPLLILLLGFCSKRSSGILPFSIALGDCYLLIFYNPLQIVVKKTSYFLYNIIYWEQLHLLYTIKYWKRCFSLVVYETIYNIGIRTPTSGNIINPNIFLFIDNSTQIWCFEEVFPSSGEKLHLIYFKGWAGCILGTVLFLLQIIVNRRWLPDIMAKVKWCVQWPAILQWLLCPPAQLCKKVQRCGVTERSRSYPAVPKLFSRRVSTFPDNAVSGHTKRHIQRWSSGGRQMASITSSISRSEQHWAFMACPRVQSAKWISTPFIPQSFPSSKEEGKHPITYSPQLGRQRSMRDWTSSKGRSYFLIRHLMFKHC